MKDHTLIKLSLAWSLIGLFVLILLASAAKPPLIKISQIENYVGKTVIIQGEVLKVTYKETVSFIDVKDETGKISIVVFNRLDKKFGLGDLIAVKGQIKVYKGDLELIASEIFCTKCGT